MNNIGKENHSEKNLNDNSLLINSSFYKTKTLMLILKTLENDKCFY